jgi:prepilin-type N-terminal cleavage/methylation domain-containing protein
MHRSGAGFSLLELLIVIAVIAIIFAIGGGFYVNYGKKIEIDSVSQTITFDLKQAQSKAMIGQGGYKWGIRFINGTSDYYEIFSTPSDYAHANSSTTIFMFSGVTFSSPGSGASTDIIFSMIAGTTTPASIAIVSGDNTRTISVSSLGGTSVQ